MNAILLLTLLSFSPNAVVQPLSVAPASQTFLGLDPSLAASAATGLATGVPALLVLGALAVAIPFPPALFFSLATPIFLAVSIFSAPISAVFASGPVGVSSSGFLAAGVVAGAIVGALAGAAAGHFFYFAQRPLIVLDIMHTDGTDGGWGLILMYGAGGLCGLSVGSTVAAWATTAALE